MYTNKDAYLHIRLGAEASLGISLYTDTMVCIQRVAFMSEPPEAATELYMLAYRSCTVRLPRFRPLSASLGAPLFETHSRGVRDHLSLSHAF